eukprot:6476358-Amphidinium_carterae.1
MVTWIGAKLKCNRFGISVQLKDQIFNDLKIAIDTALHQNFIKLSLLRTLVGKASFAAGLMPVIRPFLNPLWAALHSKTSSGSSHAPEGTIWTKQVRHCLEWLRTFFFHAMSEPERQFPVEAFIAPAAAVRVELDASPWSLGGLLIQDDKPIRMFTSKLTHHDEAHYGHRIGDASGQQTWECLAVLVAIRHWRAEISNPSRRWALVSDSVAALMMMQSLSSRGEGPSAIAREIALDLGLMSWQPVLVQHKPGQLNLIPDALSRLYQPGKAEECRAALPSLMLELTEIRTPAFYRCSQLR